MIICLEEIGALTVGAEEGCDCLEVVGEPWSWAFIIVSFGVVMRAACAVIIDAARLFGAQLGSKVKLLS